MASKIKEYRQRKADLVAQLRDLISAEKTDDGEKKYLAAKAELDGINAAIEKEEFLLEQERSLGTAAAPEPKPAAAAAGEVRPFASLGEQLRAVALAATGRPDPRLVPAAVAAGMNEGTADQGGFLVQSEFVGDIVKAMFETGEILKRVRKVPVGASFNGVKMNGVDETSRATGSRWGGVRGYWQAEAAAMSDSKPKFRQIEMSLQKLTGLAYATEELLEDTTALGAVISQAMPEELTFLAENAIFRGSGSGEPLGFLGAPCTVTVSKESGQAAATVKSENVLKMDARLHSKSHPSAVWFCNADVKPQLPAMTIGGTAATPVYLPPGGLSGSQYGTLLGKPVIPVEYCETLGTKGDLVLVDLSQYLFIDKGGIQAASSIHVKFLTNEQTFRFTYRANGQPAWSSAITPFKGSSTLSPFVALETRS